MSNGKARESRKGSARLPLALILLTIAGLAGLLAWLTLTPPAPKPSPPVAKIAIGSPASEPPPAAMPAAPAAPEETAPPAPPPAPPMAGLPPVASDLPPAATGPALSEAPDPGLIEPSPHGDLPIVGRDGREAWRVYARPFDESDRRPRIAVVLSGLGMDAATTQAAIRSLPGAVSLAFSPYAKGLDSSVPEARAAGHETLLMVPMETADFPISDPGPRALLTTLSDESNIDRLEWVLARATGYVGVTEWLGSRFTTSANHMQTLLRQLRKRGLLYLAGRREAAALVEELARPMRLPFAVGTIMIDKRATRSLIDAQLLELERLARRSGQSIGKGNPYPITIERLAHWTAELDSRGFALVPVSALAARGES